MFYVLFACFLTIKMYTIYKLNVKIYFINTPHSFMTYYTNSY